MLKIRSESGDWIQCENWVDSDGNPAGGVVSSVGMTISWQNGPLGRGESRRPPNGAFVEDVIQAAIARLDFYQESKFNCRENADAIIYLTRALDKLRSRTSRRESQGTEGTHEVGLGENAS